MTDLNDSRIDAVLNALLRAQAVLSETGHAILINNPDSEVGKGLVWESDCARTAALEMIVDQQKARIPVAGE